MVWATSTCGPQFLRGVMEKRCSRCGETKPASEYWKGQHSCKDCKRTQLREWKARNRSHVAAKQKEWFNKNYEKNRIDANVAARLYASTKQAQSKKAVHTAKYRKELRRYVVVDSLFRHEPKPPLIPEPLIEAHRQHLKIKKVLKEKS